MRDGGKEGERARKLTEGMKEREKRDDNYTGKEWQMGVEEGEMDVKGERRDGKNINTGKSRLYSEVIEN